MSPDEAAFLRAICDAPDDDTPRLVFADWLEETGKPVNVDRAEFIRLQIRLHHEPEAEYYPDVGGRGRLLFERGHVTWTAWLPAKVEIDDFEHGWKRGFPEGFQGNFEHVRPHWNKLFAHNPFTAVYLSEVTNNAVSGLASWRELARVRHLSLHAVGLEPRRSAVFDDRAAIQLAKCPFLSGLVSLGFTGYTVGDRGMLALLESPHLAGLRKFYFIYSREHLCARNAPRLSSEVSELLIDRFGSSVFNS
jgi:uncharacterized protein (TIGR02996 family)